jgi:predicted nucleotidyltransferase
VIDQVKLYGSRAKGKFTPRSDIDLVVFGEDIKSHDISGILLTLEDTNIPNLIDLQDYQTIQNQRLIQHIDRVGVLIFQKYTKPQ